MTRSILFLLIGLSVLAGADPGASQAVPEALTGSFETAGTKIISLAEAIPAELYDWAPSEEVRTVSEVLMHVAAGHFVILNRIGAPFPEDAPAVWYRNPDSVTEKDQVLEALRRSHDWARGILAAQPTGTYGEQAANAGPGTTVVNQLVLLDAHSHEHLGQLIAYARMNGVAPPWSR